MVNLKNMNLKALQSYKIKLRELKTWAQVKSPKPLQPAISYTLGWLSPELLGTGFRMTEVSDFAIKGLVPANKMNLDYNLELNQGLVLNAAIELARTSINRHLPENFYRIVSNEIEMSKVQKWNADMTLHLASSESLLDQFFLELQSHKKVSIELSVRVEVANLKSYDAITIKFSCEATNLLT